MFASSRILRSMNCTTVTSPTSETCTCLGAGIGYDSLRQWLLSVHKALSHMIFGQKLLSSSLAHWGWDGGGERRGQRSEVSGRNGCCRPIPSRQIGLWPPTSGFLRPVRSSRFDNGPGNQQIVGSLVLGERPGHNPIQGVWIVPNRSDDALEI